ncbi:MAG: hypothetical protein AABY15_09290 [Nanoarchaeota archaeon]
MPNLSWEEIETLSHDVNNARQIALIQEKKLEKVESFLREVFKRRKLKEEKNEGSWP